MSLRRDLRATVPQPSRAGQNRPHHVLRSLIISTSSTTFGALGVPAPLTAVLADRGITTPTPIQAATLPDSLAGRDVLGRGRTGSGKTYAFVLPVLARLAATPARPRPGRPRALILAPTRELATQIEEALTPLAATLRLKSRTIFGGVNQNPQVNALRNGVDIVVACPGRLEDLIGQGHCRLDDVSVTVLDEADHMADLGFLPVVRRILERTPTTGQRLLFSATLDAAVDGLVRQFLRNPVTHQADSAMAPVDTMTHQVLRVADTGHLAALVELTTATDRTVVFTRTKSRAKRLARQLNSAGVTAVELHGNLSQGARTRTMEAFHGGHAKALVATDIAARGIHVDDVGLVVHADPPAEHKAYLHRSGRTARAGAGGTVITLATDAQSREVSAMLRKAGIKPEHAQHTDDSGGALAARVARAAGADRAPSNSRAAGAPRGTGVGRAPNTPRAAGAGRTASTPRAAGARAAGANRGTTANRGAAAFSARTAAGRGR
ncbi:MAG: DEAD/DEAH box helicase [Austwickia sp.]|nr:DEAD/DEAH box helicase [Austwickia sp.]MBK8437271.1 DEAD/DEAH box helicase [Austwickia sp.]MBK9102504.1 DEAD/DEAH box helicase [Austwickia sp.]